MTVADSCVWHACVTRRPNSGAVGRPSDPSGSTGRLDVAREVRPRMADAAAVPHVPEADLKGSLQRVRRLHDRLVSLSEAVQFRGGGESVTFGGVA